ncbi:MAG: permease [Velocimicrobium sp.]
MATYVDIITGFLESGKTTLIQELLNSKMVRAYSRIVLVVGEEGITEYEEEQLKAKNITSIVLEKESDISGNMFRKISKQYNPDYIVIEYNGTWNISKLLSSRMPVDYKFRNVIFVSDAGTFKNQLSNMAVMMQPHILNSDIVAFNRYQKINVEMQKKLVRNIKNINPRTKVTFITEVETDKVLNEYFMESGNKENISLNLKSNLKLIIITIICFLLLMIFMFPNVHSYVQSIVTVFLSILMQAVPFILLGAFISAIIQIFASKEWIMNQISKGSWESFLIASVAGFFLPICDCGMVPIISGLLKKETPLPQTITFWLASSAVSPVVIISMLYAFPEHPYLAIIRVVSGVGIAITVGILLKLIHLKTQDVVKENQRVNNIGKDILELKYEGIKGKIEAVFAGAKVEFFRVSEYVIIGALISAFLQTIMPQAMKNVMNNNLILQFMIMIVAAMLMSTCSTSNAFIGRSFSNNFATVPILSFIVMGPMLDLKNMIMLSEVLKKRFLIILACMVIVQSAIIFGVLSLFL